MKRLFIYFLRFCVILFGYLAACLAAGAFLNVLVLGWLGLTGEEARQAAGGSALFSVPLTALFISYFAFIPGMVAIFAAEFLRRRDWLYHAAAGAAVALVALLMRGASADGEAMSGGSGPMLAVLAAGLVGGIAYWAVSGRFAGSWRPTAISPGR